MYTTADEIATAARNAQDGWYDSGTATIPQGNYTMAKLVEGAEYIYIAAYPKTCQGNRYRLLRFVTDLPSYQQKVLVEGTTGPDTGACFVVSEATFANKFERVPEPTPTLGGGHIVQRASGAGPVVVAEDVGKVAGEYHKGSGV